MDSTNLKGTYFPLEDSIGYRVGDVSSIVKIIADRYIGENPPLPFVLRTYSRNGFSSLPGGKIVLDLNQKHPQAENGQTGFIAGRLWQDQETDVTFLLECLGPVRLFVNKSLIFRSLPSEEVNSTLVRRVTIPLQKGWNDFVFRCIKTNSGFGCRFAFDYARWMWKNFCAPFCSRSGMLSFAYSECFVNDNYDDPPSFSLDEDEASTHLKWFPSLQWDDSHHVLDLKRLFNHVSGGHAYCKTNFIVPGIGMHLCTFRCRGNYDRVHFYLDGTEASLADDGNYACKIPSGIHEITIDSSGSHSGLWEFCIDVECDGRKLLPCVPAGIKGAPSPWIVLGPFPEGMEADGIFHPSSLQKLFDAGGTQIYWRVYGPDLWVRLSLEEKNFGRWNYPLGVTLYGILQAGRFLNRQDMIEYATDHITQCTDTSEYAMWDAHHYGFPAISNQLVGLEMLDDCGSFASAMLEAYSDIQDENSRCRIRAVSDRIAEYILHKQERLPDGTFFRNRSSSLSKETLWADDLYMSTPFLIRYYALTKDEGCLEEVKKQFLLFRKYLYMPELKIMSHVFDFKSNAATNVPWGRGNGWVLFSLSEILPMLPADDPDREELLSFFQDLSSGYLALQGERGLWHQVLTYQESYEEASCTAMFIYAFSRGIRYRWYNPLLADKCADGVVKAWEGLSRYCIRKTGDVYGVCQGSGYSFLPYYYMHDLHPL